MLFHSSLYLKFVHNFDVSCQEDEFFYTLLKVEFKLSSTSTFEAHRCLSCQYSSQGIASAILSPVDNFRRWRKLNFRFMGGQVLDR